jgi:type F conjugative transfer system protein TrbI
VRNQPEVGFVGRRRRWNETKTIEIGGVAEMASFSQHKREGDRWLLKSDQPLVRNTKSHGALIGVVIPSAVFLAPILIEPNRPFRRRIIRQYHMQVLEVVTAQVAENIFDSPTGRARLMPQGAKLLGVHDSQIAFGQSRVLLVWTRLIMPNGRSIVLERQQGADVGGYSGLEDEVDNHWPNYSRRHCSRQFLVWELSLARVLIAEVIPILFKRSA